jgi:probable rRNA maturation factor
MIDINNESGVEVDELRPGLAGRFALEQLRIHPQADLSILLVDEATMADYHERFMDLPGPTDVMSFPMDELRRPPTTRTRRWAARRHRALPDGDGPQAAENGRDRPTPRPTTC